MRALTRKGQKREESSQNAERPQHLVRPLHLAFEMSMPKRVLLQGEQSNILVPCPLDASLHDRLHRSLDL